MASIAAYNADMSTSLDVEFANDPASGGFFNSDYKRHEDLKQMLDSNKDGLKLEAMKRIIGMVARGRNASELFPAVVKNVVNSNLEVKKLVYVYLVRYAEEQQDLALLSISTFQRALKDPNQLIRGCALRVLSSIRVPVIVPIMMLAIKDAVSDMSPYVRRTAAHAIPKLYSLDPDQKCDLIQVIDKLLSDKTILVVGSAVMAFEEVCPERIDLIHKNYRKLCSLLVDVEEWGQVIIINMLTRYARTQFVDPNKYTVDNSTTEQNFFDDKGMSDKSPMDPDHRLLLSNSKILLQSRNAAVVLSVAQLYQHVAPQTEVVQVAKALVRLLHGHREVQAVVLTNIASLSTQQKGMFEPFLKSFFVRSNDPTHVKILKLEILTNLSNPSNISTILREFQTYIRSSDKEFIAATIQSIGRCASNIKEVADICLSGLVSLMSSHDELIVGESVVVIRKLLQSESVGHKDIIKRMARLLDTIKIPMARASILWLLGEYCSKVPKIAPDILRNMAKNFTNEDDIVKLQILTFATKLYLTNPTDAKLLTQYIYNLAKYDVNYDIRDRTRMLRALVFGTNSETFSKHVSKIFLSLKPAPLQQSSFKDRYQFQLSTLSHFINARASGYEDLPEFPEVAPDPNVRNIEVPAAAWSADSAPASKQSKTSQSGDVKSFYSSEASDEEDSEGMSVTSSSSESSSDNDKEEEEEEGSSRSSTSESSTSGSDKSSSEGSESDSDSEKEKQEKEENGPSLKNKRKVENTNRTKEISNLDLLMNLEDGATAVGTALLTPSTAASVVPAIASPKAAAASFSLVPAKYIPQEFSEILNRFSGDGLSVSFRFTRSPHLFSPLMTSLELKLKNHSDAQISQVYVNSSKVNSDEFYAFPNITSISPGEEVMTKIGVNFRDTSKSPVFELCVSENRYSLCITAPVGELMQPISMKEDEFDACQAKLKGMNEQAATLNLAEKTTTFDSISGMVHKKANIFAITCENDCMRKFAGQTTSEKVLVLVTISLKHPKCIITVSCEKIALGSILLKDLKEVILRT